ncbi:MAG: hypothetical protein HRU75_00995 [Planctomycetia bacterium]|nr:MAG: hypothetical protein HRU75_00995 [Planctomycetia bacterium]
MNKSLVIGAVVAVLAVGGYYGYQYFGGGGFAATHQSACGYDDCDWTGNAEVRLGEPFPAKCPKCGRSSILPVQKCSKCGHLQIANERLRAYIDGKDKLPAQTKCDKCGTPIRQGG